MEGFLNTVDHNGNKEIVPCGLTFQKDGKVIGLPLLSVEANIQIIANGAQVTLHQYFMNGYPESLMATYFFPIECDAAVCFFEARFDGRILTGKVETKEDARKEFSQAIEDNQTAFLLEEVKSDILELFIGNLNPGSECEIIIKYIHNIPVQEGSPRFTLPTTIAPRFIPHGDLDNDVISSINLQYLDTKDIPIAIKANLSSTSEIKSISSPTHKISSDINSKKNNDGMYCGNVELKVSLTDMDKDFVLVYDCIHANETSIIIEKHGSSSAMILSLTPHFEIKNEKCEFVFLVDCSGSMGGESIGKARDALKIFLRSLPEDSYFNIYKFGTSYEKLFDTSSQYGDKSMKKANSYAAKIEADLGGTVILDPLQDIISSEKLHGYEKRIIVLTDGQVSNTSSVLSTIKYGNCRVFSLGIGSSASRELVKGMAIQGNGISLFCTLNEPMYNKVITLLNAAKVMAVSIDRIELFNEHGDKVESEDTFTTSLPMMIYSNERVTHCLINQHLNDHVDKVICQCRHGNKEVEIVFTSEFLFHLNTTQIIHQLTVAKVIKECLIGDEEKCAIPQLIDLALKYGLVTNATSLLCIDTDSSAIVSRDQMENRKIGREIMGMRRGLLACGLVGSTSFASTNTKMLRKGGFGFPSFSLPKISFTRSKKSKKSVAARCKATNASHKCDISKDEMVKVLELSNFKGIFTGIKEFCTIIDIDEERFKKQNTIKASDDVFLTYACLIYLKARHDSDRNAWSLIIDKSEGWLRKQNPNLDQLRKLDLEAFFREAISF